MNVVSPIAAVAAVGMMLDYLGEKKAAEAIETTIASLLVTKRIPSLDASSGLKTSDIGDLIASTLAR
jgi:3-isopropylmalate dehydrogenase